MAIAVLAIVSAFVATQAGHEPTIRPDGPCPNVVQAERTEAADTFAFGDTGQSVRVVPEGANDAEAVTVYVDGNAVEIRSRDISWDHRSPENVFVFRRDCSRGPRIVVVLRDREGEYSFFERVEIVDGQARYFGPNWTYPAPPPFVIGAVRERPIPEIFPHPISAWRSSHA